MRSHPYTGPNDLLVNMHPSVSEFAYSRCYHLEELILPYRVQFIYFLISRHTVRCEIVDKVLACLCILLGLYPCSLSGSMSVFFGFFPGFVWLRRFR